MDGLRVALALLEGRKQVLKVNVSRCSKKPVKSTAEIRPTHFKVGDRAYVMAGRRRLSGRVVAVRGDRLHVEVG